ncbi:hypothetical protein A5784_20970 [Mycobacterium sp. 852013-50091_SCH5140682]|uniref:DUF4255 domain-containing protein n=1 Tax=Mycobacterium sp. 852013-50091_SCH5140682 TaxID=1834109 RepID=UPI0007EBD634|nr:DUF4255 domain-containing protein [Mycobacterium sp. 852013-50091_SCH5140682]OBC00013.1 hypothetical protein A5784_20970 [Mycobacterium sp. 852013-50091_SCH5140682]
MSDARAIEGVTQTLLQVIDDAVNKGPQSYGGGVKVIAQPPHEVQTDIEPLQVNLFLYRTEIAPGLRNEDPLDITPGETGQPPLPLALHYLITPYVQGGKDLDAHRLLGLASRAVQEQSQLSQTQLHDSAAFSNVSTQLDRIRITWQALAENDIYSLWSAFQTPYRLSAAFEVRVVFIDNRRPPRTPVPVIRRGQDDQGPTALADTASPFPELDAAVAANGQTAAQIGESVELQGINLSAATVSVSVGHPLLPAPILLAPTAVTATAVTVDLAAASGVPAGVSSASVSLTDTVAAEQVTTITNAVPLAVAPRITSAVPMTVHPDAQGSVQIALSCAPPVVDGQPVFLLVGDRAVPEDRARIGTAVVGENLSFTVDHAVAGRHIMRLRVAGVDSRLVDRSGAKPRFDDSQAVTVTP